MCIRDRSSDESEDESTDGESSTEVDVDDDDSTDSGSETSEQDEEVKVRAKLSRASLQEQREFDREMNKFLGASATSMLGSRGIRNHSSANPSRNNTGGTIAFKMLVKNQGKQTIKELNVPERAEFVANVKEALKAEEAELAEVKRKILTSTYHDDDAPAIPGPRGWRPNNRRSEHNISRRL